MQYKSTLHLDPNDQHRQPVQTHKHFGRFSVLMETVFSEPKTEGNFWKLEKKNNFQSRKVLKNVLHYLFFVVLLLFFSWKFCNFSALPVYGHPTGPLYLWASIYLYFSATSKIMHKGFFFFNSGSIFFFIFSFFRNGVGICFACKLLTAAPLSRTLLLLLLFFYLFMYLP